MNEKEVMIEMAARGCKAPAVTVEMIDDAIVSEEFHTFHGKHMVCCLTLKNGFTVTGEAAVVSPENFREDMGRRFSRARAREKVWGFEAYLLQEKLHQEKIA